MPLTRPQRPELDNRPRGDDGAVRIVSHPAHDLCMYEHLAFWQLLSTLVRFVMAPLVGIG